MIRMASPAHHPDARTRPRPLRATLALAGSSRRDLRGACASLAAQQLLVAVEVAVAAYVVSRAVRGATYDQLSPWILVLVLAALPQVRLPWAGSAAFTAVANRVRVDQADRLFRAVDGLDPSDAAGRRTGELTSVAADDLSHLVGFFAHDLGSLVSTATMMILAVVSVVAMDWRLGAVVAIVLAGLVALASLDRSSGLAGTADQSDRQGRAEIIDDLQGLREIVVAGAADRTAADLRARTLERDGGAQTGPPRSALGLVGAGTTILPGVVLVMAGVLVAGHGLSPTLVAPTVALTLLAARAGGRWAATWPRVRRALDSTDRIRALEVADPGHGLAPNDPTPPSIAVPVTTDIEFDHVHVRYRESGPDALEDVSFRVEQGTTVALVGHSGAGKSSAVRLVLGFLRADAGTVRIGGCDLAELPEATRAQLVGYVPQDTYLFNTTVRRNLQLGRPDATDTELEAAARTAMAWEFIGALPGGLDAVIGERGAQLSGGQRQRLAIARALVADRPILVLDEPVSSLDVDNETALLEAMHAARRGRTTLIVAHRRSTTRQADQVVVLDQGRVTAISTGADHHGLSSPRPAAD